jgi:hypothetical protein
VSTDQKYRDEAWTLHVTFDPVETAHLESGVDEPFAFARYAANRSGALHEEMPVFMKWEKDEETGTRTVTVTSDVLDYLSNLQVWVSYHTIPRKVELVRNKERGW